MLRIEPATDGGTFRNQQILSLVIALIHLLKLDLVKIAGFDTPFEEFIKLPSRSALSFRQPEPDTEEADESGCAKDEANLSTEVSGIWVEHVGKREANEPLNKAESKVRQALCSGSKSQCRNLSYNGPRNSSKSELICKCLPSSSLDSESPK